MPDVQSNLNFKESLDFISKTQKANSGNIYGNTPTYYNSLLQGYTDTTNGNISGTIDPMFVNPQMAGDRAPIRPAIIACNSAAR